MKRRLKELAILGSVLGVIGLIVLVSGIFPVKASSGHWAVTRWLLDFASDRSVAFHSTGIETPPLNEPGMIALGAAIYESNCASCHGQPVATQPPVAQGMTPAPPKLSRSVSGMKSRELFYILKHGIKFTAMPAWPTQNRDDEIWPVVAFLHDLPTMDLATYRALLERSEHENGDVPKAVFLVRERCASCHGMDGNGFGRQRVPIIASQSEAYLRTSLVAYRAGERASGIMMPIAHRLTDSEIDKLAKFFSKQHRTATAPDTGLDQAGVDVGRQLAEKGNASDKIPSCVDCHGPGANVRSSDYPVLAGQPAWYIERQLELFSKRHRGGSAQASLMHPIADKLSETQRHALAAFYESVE